MAKDNDGNQYDVGVVTVADARGVTRAVVGVHVNGVWLSPRRAKAFAGRIVAVALRVERKNRKR